MVLVDANNITYKDKIYQLIPQPMVVYHNSSEFYENEKNPIVISSLEEFLKTFNQCGLSLKPEFTVNINRYKSALDFNLWIKTVDKYVPLKAESDGTIHYKLNNDGELIETDGCYVRLFYYIPMSNKIVLYTSAGVNSITFSKWEITAAVRTQFREERKLYNGTEETYRAYLNNLLYRSKPTTDMYRFLFAYLNPMSPTFLNVDKSARVAVPKLRAADRQLIIQSKQFGEAMKQALKIMLPELSAKVRDSFTPEKIVQMLEEAYKISLENKDSRAVLEVIREITDYGYANPQVEENILPQINQNVSTLTVPEAIPKLEETFDEVKEELNYPDSFIWDDSISEIETENETDNVSN